MHLLYNLGIRFYGLGIRLASMFNTKAKKWRKGRKNLLSDLPDLSSENVYWFHCASLGEFDMALPLMNQIRKNQSDAFILATFFSPSGMENFHKRENPVNVAYYLPLDTPSNATKFIEKVKPKYSFFIKYEFWSNFIFEAKKAESKIYNVSGIFWPHHRFFRLYGGFFRKTLRAFDHFFVQNDQSKKLLGTINILNCSVTGDSRYDRVIENKASAEKSELISMFTGGKKVFIAGSTWQEDEKILLPLINEMKDKVIIAPHEISEDHLTEIEIHLDRPHIRFTNLKSNPGLNADILILDTIGHLASAYVFGSCAYIGGGFSGNLHNILEPAVFGLPVIFGPKHKRFPEAQQFIENGFGFSVSTYPQLKSALNKINEKDSEYTDSVQRFISSQSGASMKIYNSIFTSN